MIYTLNPLETFISRNPYILQEGTLAFRIWNSRRNKISVKLDKNLAIL